MTHEEERNYCPRCGKRLGKSDWDVHTCTPPQENPAPCARHCEANAFQIVIKNLKAQLAQRKPLSDEEIDAIYTGVRAVHHEIDSYVFARAIEAAHNIKENKHDATTK